MACASCQQSGPHADQVRRARAVLCHSCVWASRERGQHRRWTAVGCTVSGKTVEHHVSSCAPSCPKKKHPDMAGMVRWLWIEWYGVPKPLRWVVRPTGPVPGCGCIKVLKNAWLWAKPRILRLVAGATKRGVRHHGSYR